MASGASCMDECISCSEYGVFSLTSDITFAYLTYDDVQRISSLKEQTVIVIKAPAETKLEVPNPEEVLFKFSFFVWKLSVLLFEILANILKWFGCTGLVATNCFLVAFSQDLNSVSLVRSYLKTM